MTLILISCQQQGRPFDYYYVKIFQRHFAIFMPMGVFAMKIPPPTMKIPPIPSVLSHVSVSELYMLYTG